MDTFGFHDLPGMACFGVPVGLLLELGGCVLEKFPQCFSFFLGQLTTVIFLPATWCNV